MAQFVIFFLQFPTFFLLKADNLLRVLSFWLTSLKEILDGCLILCRQLSNVLHCPVMFDQQFK